MRVATCLLPPLLLTWCASPTIQARRVWDGILDFQKFGYDVLPCPTYQRAECCICKHVVTQLNSLLENPRKDKDYEVEVLGSKPGQQRRKVPYVRTMAGIADALENVCYTNVSMSIAKAETRVEEATDLFFYSCRSFTNDFEEYLQGRCCVDGSTCTKSVDLVHDICVKDTNLCDGLEESGFSNPPLWDMSVREHAKLTELLHSSVDVLDTIIELYSSEVADRSLSTEKEQRAQALTNTLFFKLGAASSLARVPKPDAWRTLFQQDVDDRKWDIVRVKLMNKIYAASSFRETDLFLETEAD